MTQRLVTAIDIDGAGAHPNAWRVRATEAAAILDGSLALRTSRLAEAAGVDLVTFADTFEASDLPRLDAVALASSVAPVTDRIGLVPTVTTTHTEPFHVQASIATLDHVSEGRAGWLVEVSSSGEAAALVGRRPQAPADEIWREARYVADVSRRLWDSWQDDAIIRDASTGRFIDRDRLHYVDFEAPTFKVKGPSIVPRPPQGHPVTVVRFGSPESLQAAAHADVVLLPGPEHLAARLATVRRAVARAGRAPGEVRVLVSASVHLGDNTGELGREVPIDFLGAADRLAAKIAAWAEAGVDGIHLRPAVLAVDVPLIADWLFPLLRQQGLAASPSERVLTLRQRLGLRRPGDRYAVAQ